MASLHPMDIAEAEDREANGLEFQCEDCRQWFVVPFDEYRGQWDHGDTYPICDDCIEKRDEEDRDAMRREWK